MSRPSHLRQLQLQQQMADDESAALAAEIFDHFCVATTMRQTLGLYRNMCDTVGLRPGPLNEFYPKLKAKIRSWKAQALWKKFDARAAHRVYNKGNACTGTRVLVIGAGPCGLRTAIEAQLLGAKVVVVEKRDRISRNNVLHLWPFVITDLRNLGAKKFYGKFCAGSIDHISIRQLQCILLKVALLLGVEIHEGVSFLRSLEPSDGCGWRAQISPEDHAVSHYEFDVLIGADGKRNTLEGFKRKEFRGKLAIAITANFINKKTEAEAKAEEISGVAFIFNQSFFKELYATTGIDLENIVYYKDETHYFVMTAKKHSLIDKGVIIQDFADPAELLAPVNVNTEKLLDYAREAAEFSTKYQMPNLEFAVNHYGKPDVAMFDFTSMFAAETSCRVIVRKNYRLLQCLVGDSLLEPFWPTGSGCARGFLSSMDAAYAIKLWNNSKNSILGVLAQRESIYRLLAQTTPENLHRDIGAYTVDPATRYPNLNKSTVNVWQVKHLIDTDDKAVLEQIFMDTNAIQAAAPETPARRKRRTGDTLPISTVLLRWIKAQLHGHEFSHQLSEVSECFTGGNVLCSLINRYRPDLVDLNAMKDCTPLECNEIAFKILENDLNIPRVMTAKDSVTLENVDSKIWLNYLEQICEVFRGEIPHVKHPKLDFAELKEKCSTTNTPDFSRLLKIGSKKSKSPMQDIDVGNVVRRSVLDEDRLKRQRRHGAENIPAQQDTTRRAKKRRSQEKSTNIEERQQRIKEIEANRLDRQNKRRLHRFQQTENFYKSLHMLQANNFLRESDSSSPFEDYSIYLYRQQAPKFNDRVKDLERKLLYPDRERGIQSALPRGLDDNFSDRIKSMEQRITSRGNANAEKKPKDLLRSIGKLESTDWNIREIEKKIEQSKKTEIGKNKEKVPKWSKEQFLARQNKMAKPEKQESTEEKFKEIDQTLKNLDKQLKEGSILEVGERGRNKVASIAGQFVKINETREEKIQSLPKSSSNLFNKQPASEKCHFCKQTVYLMEKTSTEGLILHRSCLKCHHCHTNLRLGAYAFDRDDPDGRFYCTQHFKLPAKAVRPVLKKPSKKRSIDQAQLANDEVRTKGRPEDVVQLDMLDRGQTPERIEFENTDAMSDGEPSLENIIDENEWTDRNFLSGSDDLESDLSSSESSEDDSDSDLFEEANGSPIGAQTLQLATDWIGKQRYSNMEDSDDEDFYDSSEGLLDDDADSQTEGEELKKAREMRRQEVKLMPPPAYLPTDTETEVQTDSESSSPDDIELNSATEISTDSEFDHDPIILEAPRIFIDDTHLRKPTKVQVKQSVINNTNLKTVTPNAPHQKSSRQQEVEFKPLVQVDPSLLSSNRMPLKNPNPGDYLLNKTPSTEGIASKKSLELKKRYLLGEQGIGNVIMKSGSTSILDSKLRSFHSNISECQRLLNPGSKTMLDRTKTEDKSSESSKKDSEKENDIVENMNVINRDMKFSETVNTVLVENVLKGVSDTPLKPSEVETIDLNTPEKSVPIIDLTNTDTPSNVTKINQNFVKNVSIENNLSDDIIDLTIDSPIKEEKDSKVFKKEDCSEKPDISKDVKETIPDIITHTEDIKMENYSADRSLLRESKQPAVDSNENKHVDTNENDIQETCILVPNILPWGSKKKSDVESDSLSDTSSSLEDIPHFILDSTTSPDTQNALEKIVPRVEVHDTSGALMQIDSLMIIDGKYIGDPEDLKHLEIPEGTVIDLPNENHVEKPNNFIKDKSVENLMKSSSKLELKFDTKNENKINTLKNIPLIIDSDEKIKAEKPTNLEFSKTKIELQEDKDRTPTMEETISDSETEFTGQVLTETELSDWTADDAVSENFVDIEFVLNSNKGTIKRNKRGKKKGLPKLKQPRKLPDPPKDCGILRNLDIEEIEFMDTGSEEGSCAEAYAATNRTLLKNRGYIEFIETTPTKTLPSGVFMDKLESDVAFKKDSSKVSEMTGNEILGIDYIEQGAYILNNDIDLRTPVNEVPVIFATKQNQSAQVQSVPTDSLNDMDEDSLALITSQGAATNTTTTEESEAITVVTSPLEYVPQIPDPQTTPSSSEKMDKTVTTPTMATKIPVRKSSTEEIRRKSSLDDTLKRKDSDEISYEEYVRKLQMKITQISNARDSIDVRKQKRKSSKGEMIESSPSNSVIENKSLSIFEPPKNNILLSNSQVQQVHNIPEIPTLTRKLEEITKERTKQKDLIHDLVMDKLQSKKQLNAEKRLNRSRNRSLFSPSGQTSILKLAPNSCSSAAHYHSPSSDKTGTEDGLHKATPLNKVQESPKETKDVVQAFAAPLRSKQRPMSDNLDQINFTFDLGPRLSKTQSFCMYKKPTLLKSEPKDQRNQSQEKMFETPVPPPRSSRRIEEVNTEKLRAEARARARLKSNEDLGLSPEEKLKLLRKRYHRDLPEATIEKGAPLSVNKSDDMKVRERKMVTSKSVNDISVVHKNRSSDENFNVKSMEAVDFTSDPNLLNSEEKSVKSRRRKDPERRKSLIQAVSNFFNKKKEKESPSPSKEKVEGMFSRFRISPKSKDKSKERDGTTYDRSNSQECLKCEISAYSSTPQLFKTTDEVSPPPIPPLPTNYQRSDDESCTNETREQKKQRAISKATRQAELKRLRIAQEIQREQEEIEVKLKELEARGVLIEKALRGEGQNMENLETSSIGATDEKLLKELLEIWRNITQLKKRDEELGIRQQELQLEHRHAQLKEELNMRLSCSKLEKSSADVAAEGAILNEMLEIVAKRAALRPNDISNYSDVNAEDESDG